MDRPYLLLSTPRSGSDWFVQDCLRWQAPQYFREYFNPATHFVRSSVIRLAFGSEVDWENIALPWECQADLLEYVYQASWALDRFRFAKENYSASKIGFFRKHFECFALVGFRQSTFPGGSQPRSTDFWWTRYFQSLEFNRDLLDEDLRRLVDFALAHASDHRKRMVSSQVIATYLTVRECRKNQIPILEYRKILSATTPAEVRDYLRDKIPISLMDDKFPDRVVATRKVTDKSAEYEAWGVEQFAQGLIQLIPPDLKSYF